MHELGAGQVHVQKYVEVITQCAEDPHLMLSGLLKGWFPNMFHFNQCWFSLLSLSFFLSVHLLVNATCSTVYPGLFVALKVYVKPKVAWGHPV